MVLRRTDEGPIDLAREGGEPRETYKFLVGVVEGVPDCGPTFLRKHLQPARLLWILCEVWNSRWARRPARSS